MTISPVAAVVIVTIIVTLALLCSCFAIAWRRTELENAVLRRQRAARAIGPVASGEARRG